MKDYLVFRLYGPMAAWGEIAIGESRHSATHPSKSAILGLMAAALGIRRDEDERQTELASAYGIGVKLLTPGSLLKDYHTAQVPRAEKNVRYFTRKQELEAGSDKIGTILSSREYRCDSLAIVAVWGKQNTLPYTLQHLVNKLARPEFHLYLGRKSCPLSAPVQARVLTFPDLRTALDKTHFCALYMAAGNIICPSPIENELLPVGTIRYFWEETENAGIEAVQSTQRYDQPTSRSRWQFDSREEHMSLAGGNHVS